MVLWGGQVVAWGYNKNCDSSNRNNIEVKQVLCSVASDAENWLSVLTMEQQVATEMELTEAS